MNYNQDEDNLFGFGECTCRLMGRGGNDPDAYYKINKDCPIHGRDPDADRERLYED